MTAMKRRQAVKWSRSKCGCRWIPGMLQHCKRHGAADDLLAALKALVEADWMVTHDWGGDRDAVLSQAQAAIAKGESK